MIEVGSTSHHGELFIGTDNRRSAQLGVGAFIGWSLAGGKVLASGYGSALAGCDSGSPRGLVIRTPFDHTADPDLSIGWVDNHSRTNYGALSASGGARYVTPANVKFGPLVSAEAVVGFSKVHAEDKSGSRTVDKISRSFRAAVNGSATLVASPLPVPIGSQGPFNSISFSSAPVVGVGTTLMQTGTGSTLRLYEVDGQIVPERTFRDTEFTKIKNT
ncbi:hypothetical protein [Robbsia sp. KACC 23696]|uniref:hypothetical protein n=1 Tax=Robbsia sp. KACC 23696 TaxID=3149231 RepID=UPI00325AA301